MGIALLNELQDRLHTAVIAGVSVIGEDFRLRRAVEQFETLSASAPVLAKVYQQVKPLLDPACPDKEGTLIEAVTLVDAVVCTQGASQVDGAIEPILAEGDPEGDTLCRYSDLEPLLTALTTKGSGRYEIIENAWKQNAPALRDFRLKSALIGALGDTYAELAELVQRILTREGAAIIPLLKYQFDPQGGREMARRLEIMEQVAGGAENGFYCSLLAEKAAAVIREEAIHALRFRDENTSRLIELSVTEKGGLKKRALCVLGQMNSPEADAFWLKELEKKNSTAEDYLTLNSSPVISDRIAEKLETLLDSLPPKKNGVVEKEATLLLCRLISAIPNKCTERMVKVLERIAVEDKQLSTLRNESKGTVLQDYAAVYGDRGEDAGFLEVVNDRLIAGMADTMRPELIECVKALYRRMGTAYITAGLAAWLLTDPDHAYDEFEPWFHEDRAVERILRCFRRFRVEGGWYGLYYRIADMPGETRWVLRPLVKKLDPRWFAAMTTEKRNHFYPYFDRPPFGDDTRSLMVQLLNQEDAESLPVMRDFFYREAQQGRSLNSLYALNNCGCKDFRGLIPKYFRNVKRFNYYEMTRLYSYLPIKLEDAVSELEQIADLIEKGKIHSQYRAEFDRVREYAANLRKMQEG